MSLPALDCHAHVAPDVTTRQVKALGNVIVFAVTRSLDEAEIVRSRRDGPLIWGCGMHPGVRSARMNFDVERFSALAKHFALIGEIGLDRRAGDLATQRELLHSILGVVSEEPVLLSIHSVGAVVELLELLESTSNRGTILHWFNGDPDAVRQAGSLGCYFSVNAAMRDDVLTSIPLERMLPETDFPATRRHGCARPGDTVTLETRVSRLLDLPTDDLRLRWYRNLRAVAAASGAIDRLPEHLVDILVPL